MTHPVDHAERMRRAQLSLRGLSVGDALGERFFSPWVRDACLRERIVPEGTWRWTDDTAMAISIVEVLEQHGNIEQDVLAKWFAARYMDEPNRGYGPAQHDLLRAIHRGADWSIEVTELFRGSGSFGNGGAMRVAPVGAYFADDLSRAATEAAASAEVTHAHPEGKAGAIAVAVAAAWAWQWNQTGRSAPTSDLLHAVLEHTPRGKVYQMIELATRIALDEWEFDAANQLGDGSNVTAMDTVPFCLWVAARHLDDYVEALWTAIRVHGDIDTNCAIIGGIIGLVVGENGIPKDWQRNTERLPSSGESDS